MTEDDATHVFEQQSLQEKALLLARLSHQLTIAARDTYTVGSDGVDDPARLRAFNEIQHRVTGFHAALISGTARYPDDVFVRMMWTTEDSTVREVFEQLLAQFSKRVPELMTA